MGTIVGAEGSDFVGGEVVGRERKGVADMSQQSIMRPEPYQDRKGKANL